jgi:Leucine-rich repeat (LRR) protein
MVKLNGDYLKEKLTITKIQDQFSLNLSSNNIDEIDPSLFHNCKQLEGLDLSGNKLQTLDKNLFEKCTNLKVLDLYVNNIHKIEPTLFHILLKMTQLPCRLSQEPKSKN